MTPATESLHDAFDATKTFLRPFSLRRFLALAVSVFFIGGISGFELNFNVGTTGLNIPTPLSGPGQLPPGIGFPQFLVFAFLGLGLLLILWYLGSLFEFVFVEQLRTRDATLSGRLQPALGSGLSLFGFRLVVGVFAAAMALFVASLSYAFGVAGILLILAVLPALAVVAVAIWLANRLTTDFVVPVMIATDRGLVDAWTSFWPELMGNLREYGLYILIRLLFGLVASVALAVGFVAVGIVVGIPFGIVYIIVLFILVEILTVGVAEVFVIVSLLLFAATVLVIGTIFVAVPIQTFLRYYALFVLGAVNPEYDLVDERRRDGGENGSVETSQSANSTDSP